MRAFLTSQLAGSRLLMTVATFALSACATANSLAQPASGQSAESQFTALQAEQNCLQLPDQPVDFGVLDTYGLRQWPGLEDWVFMDNASHLSVQTDESDVTFLRQKLEPTWQGSVHVVGRGPLSPARSYTLSQSFFLEPGFDWGGRNKGGKLGFGLGGGSTPTGGMMQDDGFSARLMWRGNTDGSVRLAVYAYSADRSQNLPWGDDYPLQDFTVPVGQWFTITMELTSNSDTGAADGRVRVWADDQLKLQRDNIHWQAAGDTPVINHLMYATFHGGNSKSWAPENTVYARFSAVCWQATTYSPPATEENDEILSLD